jgi:hypothetical protein
LVGVALLWLAFKNIDLEEVWHAIKEADYSWLIGSMMVALISHFFRALRWNQLINQQGYKTKTSTTFYAVMTGYLANLALPRMGEVSRCMVLTRKDNIPFNRLFGTVIAERVFDMMVLLLIIVLVVLFQVQRIGGFINNVIIKPLLGTYTNDYSAILILVLIAIASLAIIYILFRWLRPWLKTTMLYGKIEEFINGVWGGIKSIGKVKNKWYFLFNTFMIWFLYLVMLMMPFYSFQETSHLNIIDGLTVLAIGSLGMVAPVPGGIGAYHFIITELLTQLYDIPAYVAAAFATANHAAQTLILLLGGALSYALLVFIKRKPLNELPQKNQK